MDGLGKRVIAKIYCLASLTSSRETWVVGSGAVMSPCPGHLSSDILKDKVDPKYVLG